MSLKDLLLAKRPGFSGNNHWAGSQFVKRDNGHQFNNTGGGIINNYYAGTVDHESIEATNYGAEKEECLGSISFPEIYARRYAIDDALPHTCGWFLETREFKMWHELKDLSTHNGVLWIKGKPGAGKSTLMKHTLHHCEEIFKHHLIISHFFNARGDILEHTPQGMLQSIVYQLIDKDATLYESFVSDFRKERRVNKKKDWVWRQSQLENFVLSVLKNRRTPILLLIDALDECTENDARNVIRFLEKLTAEATQSDGTLRICLSSRHYPSIHMKNFLEFIMEENEDHKKDICMYVERYLRTRQKDLEAEINKKAAGIFLWVVLVVSLLNQAYDQGRFEKMQKVLKEVPEDLEEVFNMLLEKEDESRAETMLMLQWVLLSERSLTPEELFFGTLAGINREPVDQSKGSKDIIHRRIIHSSKGLIEIRKGNRETVQFIHLSVSDFLQRDRRLQTLDPKLAPDPISAIHGRLWACCCCYIKQKLTPGYDIKRLTRTDPFLPYVSKYILRHADKALSDSHGTRRDTQKLLRDQSDWFPWLRSLLDLEDSEKDSCQAPFKSITDVEILYLSSFYGHENLVRTLIQMGVNINAKCGRLGNALQAASANGQQGVVRLLLERGARIHAGGGIWGNSLRAASGNGEERVVQLLLANDFHVNGKYSLLESALQAASLHGEEAIVRLLIEKGADVNAQCGQLTNALQAASANGKGKIVRLLLEKGAKINAQCGRFSNALQVAAANGEEGIVQLLISEGAHVNAQGGVFFNDALQAASFHGKKETVKLLLKNGANIHSRGGMFNDPLQAATIAGEMGTVELLLTSGADVNAQGGVFDNALQAASYGGNAEIVKLLLNEGANADTQGGVFNNALQAASRQGYTGVVQLLLRRSLDVEIRSGTLNTAIQAASYGGHEWTVRLLLASMAVVDESRKALWIYLHGESYKETIRQMFEHRFMMRRERRLYQNDPGAAVHEQSEEGARSLFERSAGFEMWFELFKNYLRAASYGENDEIAQLLSRNGVDFNTRGMVCNNALRAALSNGNEVMVELLRQEGADINKIGDLSSDPSCAVSFAGEGGILRQLVNEETHHIAAKSIYKTAMSIAENKRDDIAVSILQEILTCYPDMIDGEYWISRHFI